MGRELQKKKNKSSLPKKTRNPKSKKKILNNPIIAANWNQKETLSQNYRRLGLTARLNHATGGTEKTIKILGLNDANSSRADAPAGSTADVLNVVSHKAETWEPEEIQVERDETGKIIRVIENANKKNDNPLNDLLNEFDNDSDDERGNDWNGFAMVPQSTSDNPVIRALEQAAMNGVRKEPRTQSQREEEWISRLVAKHGDNYSAMVRDPRLNPYQQTLADIKKRVLKWKKTQGKE